VKFSEFFFQGSPVPIEYIPGSNDPDATLYRQLEQYGLDHHPNPTRSGCLTSEILKSVVYEPETLNLQSQIPTEHVELAAYREIEIIRIGDQLGQLAIMRMCRMLTRGDWIS
jgi:hypothetical protein